MCHYKIELFTQNIRRIILNVDKCPKIRSAFIYELCYSTIRIHLPANMNVNGIFVYGVCIRERGVFLALIDLFRACNRQHQQQQEEKKNNEIPNLCSRETQKSIRLNEFKLKFVQIV